MPAANRLDPTANPVLFNQALRLGESAEAMVKRLSAFIDMHTDTDDIDPSVIRLPEYPKQLVEEILDNEVAHLLISMAHIDKHGYPFISVMGFALYEGKIHIASRKNGAKVKRLEENPRCSMVYDNHVPRSLWLGSLTLVGRARIERADPEKLMYIHELKARKTFRDGDPDVDQIAAYMESQSHTDRTLIILDEVEAVYLMTPMSADRPGRPAPVVSWRADRATGSAGSS